MFLKINKEGKKLKKFLSLFLCCLFIIFLYGCGNSSRKRINVVTSFYPLYIILMNLTDGIDDVSIANMSENHTGCLHDFQLQSEDMKKVEQADVFVINGAGMESFLDKITETYPKLPIIDSSAGVDIIEEHHAHTDDNHDESDENESNPHIWVSISNYIRQVENICDGLATIDPQNESKYKQNKDIYVTKLQTLRGEMHKELDNLPNKDIITFHEAFPYFAKEFGLNIVAVINREPESEPSVKEVSDTIEIVKNTKIKALFAEPQYPDTSARTIASETGAKLYTLDPGSSGEISKDAYIDAMKKNLEVLKEALS